MKYLTSAPGIKAPGQIVRAIEPRTILLHFHIFKNAGTSLDAALKKSLGPAWMQVEGADPNDKMDWDDALSVIAAHPDARAISSHTLRYPPPSSSSEVKFFPLLLLRHPIDRLASIFYFERANVNPGHPETTRIARTGSLADFVQFTLTKRPELGCDAQTSLIARSGTYHSAPSGRNLAAAKSAIRKLPIPGIVENLDQYLVLLELEGSRLLPDTDLTQPDQNRNPKRATTLLARLRQIRAQLPPRLWRKLNERNRLDLELWRFTHQIAKIQFEQTPGASGRLSDFRRRKSNLSVAPLPTTQPPQPIAELPWTGERLVEAASGDLVAEHLHRYALALEFASRCDVLDVACGEGYGAAFLAKVARKVIGVDCATSVIDHATAKYKAKNLRFVAGQAEKLPIPDSSIDLVVSFETLEHLKDHAAMMREIQRVLRPGGRLLLSTPDRKPYRAVSGKPNAFHLREFSLRQLQRLLATYFRHVSIGRQKSVSGSWIMPLDAATAGQSEYSGNFLKLEKGNSGEGAPYLIAMASDAPMPAFQASLFNFSREIDLRLKSLRQKREAERKTYHTLKAEFDKRTTWAQTLDADLQNTRAFLAEQTKLVDERTAWAKALESDLQNARAAFAEESKLVEERTAWAQTLDSELQKAQATLAEQAQLVEESSAWGKSLSAELQSAQEQITKLTQEHAERTNWAKSLDAELKKARANFTSASNLAEERTSWAKSLDAEFEVARINLAEQNKLVEERTAWAKGLDAELQKARTIIADQSKLAEERSVWGKALTAELRVAQAKIATLTKEQAERTEWAKTLDVSLRKAREEITTQSKLLEERTASIKSLDSKLQESRANLITQTNLVQERSDWGKTLHGELMVAQLSLAQLTKKYVEHQASAKSLRSDLQKSNADLVTKSKLVEERSARVNALEADLQIVRKTLADQTRDSEERTLGSQLLEANLEKVRTELAEQAKIAESRLTWGRSLENELDSVQAKLAKLTQDHAELTSGALTLEAELKAIRHEFTQLQAACTDQTKLGESRLIWGKTLETDLQRTHAALTAQTKLAEEMSAWGKSLEGELKKAQTIAAEREKSRQQTLKALSMMHRDLLGKSAEASATASNFIDARLRLESAESEVRRLTGTLTGAVVHVDHLLSEIQSLETERLVTAKALLQKEDDLNSIVTSLQAARKELARYEGRLLCRLAAGKPAKRKVSSQS